MAIVFRAVGEADEFLPRMNLPDLATLTQFPRISFIISVRLRGRRAEFRDH
jgi:hypothetical protein